MPLSTAAAFIEMSRSRAERNGVVVNGHTFTMTILISAGKNLVLSDVAETAAFV